MGKNVRTKIQRAKRKFLDYVWEQNRIVKEI